MIKTFIHEPGSVRIFTALRARHNRIATSQHWLSMAVGSSLLIATTASPSMALMTYSFSYDSGIGPLTGTLEGHLQPDDNTIEITAFGLPEVNGQPLPPLPFVGSYVNFVTNGGPPATPPPAVSTLDGSVQDFIACVDAVCNEFIAFDTTGALGFGLFPALELRFNTPNTSTFEPYEPNQWSLRSVSASESVPAPLPVFGALGALHASRKLKRRISVARAPQPASGR